MSTCSIRTVLTGALALTTAAMLAAAPAAAVAAPGATSPADTPAALTDPTTVVDPDCTFDESFAHSWTSKAGVEHVLYGVAGNESFSCESGAQWHAWRSPGEDWTSERTPYVGRLMAVTGAKKAVWLMYADSAGVHLAKRKANGNYRDVELLSDLGLGTHIIPAGALAVRDGKWWAVWTENRNPTGFGTIDLWQAKTIGTPLDRTRITDTPAEHDDQPRLAVRDDGSAFLLWTRVPEDLNLPTTVRYGESADGTWSNQEWDSGFVGAAGDVDVSGGDRVSVIWARGSTLQYADDSTGSFVPQQVATGSGVPSLAVSGGQIYIAATMPGFRGHLFSRDLDGGSWTDDVLSSSTVSSVLDVASRHGAATVYYSDEKKLLSRSTT